MADASTIAPSFASPGLNQKGFAFASGIFLRALALIHLVAFLSFWVQVPGLIGPHGILPASDYLRAAHDQIGASAYFQVPTLAWVFGGGIFLHVLCAMGVVLAVLAFAGIMPSLAFALLWACYLSLSSVGQIFLSFQWDALLLETTLFAVFLAPWSILPLWRQVEPSWISRGLLIWLLFRLMLLSGVVKLTSGDPTWRDLTALTFHYETQPLPTPLAWWSHQLPSSVHRFSCAAMMAIELVVPWFLFGPRALRHAAALLLIALQIAVALNGNYAFFNFLTIALCFLAFDDAWWRAMFRRPVPASPPVVPHTPTRRELRRERRRVQVAAAVVAYTVLLAVPVFIPRIRLPGALYQVVAAISPFSSLNNYGLFAVMTTTRPELVFEGSDDGRDWRAYELPYKPGALAKPLPVVAPHQPRLDWQLWFAALGSPEGNPWVFNVGEHLLRGTPEVLDLFSHNPFPQRPPLLVRVVRYDYHFTSPAERPQTEEIWRRTQLDFYVEPASLRGDAR